MRLEMDGCTEGWEPVFSELFKIEAGCHCEGLGYVPGVPCPREEECVLTDKVRVEMTTVNSVTVCGIRGG